MGEKKISCPICLDYICDDLYETECKHKYHKKCIIKWINKCPLCRADLSKKSFVMKLYNFIYETFSRDDTCDEMLFLQGIFY